MSDTSPDDRAALLRIRAEALLNPFQSTAEVRLEHNSQIYPGA